MSQSTLKKLSHRIEAVEGQVQTIKTSMPTTVNKALEANNVLKADVEAFKDMMATNMTGAVLSAIDASKGKMMEDLQVHIEAAAEKAAAAMKEKLVLYIQGYVEAMFDAKVKQAQVPELESTVVETPQNT